MEPSTGDVRRIIMSPSSNLSSLDLIPTCLLKAVIDDVLPLVHASLRCTWLSTSSAKANDDSHVVVKAGMAN